MSLNMKRVEKLENYLSDIVRQDPDDTIEQREQLALYLAGLEERLENLETKIGLRTEPIAPEPVPEYIRITKCSERTFWYRGRVGEILKVRSLDGADYIVEGPDTKSVYFVATQDCEPVGGQNG